jgi:hypothetical protein
MWGDTLVAVLWTLSSSLWAVASRRCKQLAKETMNRKSTAYLKRGHIFYILTDFSKLGRKPHDSKTEERRTLPSNGARTFIPLKPWPRKLEQDSGWSYRVNSKIVFFL